MAIVTLSTVKLHLQISHAVEDDLLEIMTEGAQEFVAKQTGIYFHGGDGAVVEDLDGGAEQLWPTKLPVLSVTSIVDNEGDGETYEYKHTATRIMRTCRGQVWPGGNAAVQRWRATYTAGYDATTAPAALKLIVLDLVFRAYNSRGGKSHQSAKGYGYDWQDLAGSDIAARLAAFSCIRSAG